MRLAVETYYVDVQSTGKANIPASGPLIFAANHPNSIMDTIILGTQTHRQISYMARSGLFKNPLVSFVFKNSGAIPIYRNPEGGGSNEDSFRSAFEVLENGGCIGIFPEGRNSEERRVLEIKTGTARIALGAERRNDYDLGVKIVPVGLNFENRDAFMSRVLVRFGPAIDARDFAENHRADERSAVREMTDHIQKRIREAATHIEDFRVVDLVHDIDEIYGRRLLDTILEERAEEKASFSATFDDLRAEELDDDPIVNAIATNSKRTLTRRLFDELKSSEGRSEDLDERFWVMERIAKAVKYFERTEPELVNTMKQRVWRYKDHLRQVRIRHEFLDRPPETLSFRLEAVRFTLYAIVFAIPAVWGFVHNAAPYLMTGLATSRADDEAKRAITGVVAGGFFYILWYVPIVYSIWLLSADWLMPLTYGISMPVTGYFFLRYRSQLSRYRSRILARTLFQTERQLIERLREDREELIERFDGLRSRFLAAEEAGEL